MESYQAYNSDRPDQNQEFQRLSQTIGTNVQKISQNVSSMQKLVNQLGTPQDSQDLRSQLQQIQHYTQQLVKDTSNLHKEMMAMTFTSPEQKRANKLTKERLSEELLRSINAFQSAQRVAAQKTKEDIRKAKAQNFNLADPFALGGDTSSTLIDMDNSANARRQEQMQMQSDKELRELEEREQAIRQLESDIVDVNQIFKELGTLVHEQGTIVDSIESSIESTATNVEAGRQQLMQAAGYSNKLRKKKVYLFIILAVIVAIILIIVFSR